MASSCRHSTKAAVAKLAVIPEAKRAPSVEICLEWTPGLEAQIRKLLREYRAAPHQQNVSTPQMMGRAIRKEQELENDTLRRLQLALNRHQSPVVDLDLLAAVNHLQICVESSNKD